MAQRKPRRIRRVVRNQDLETLSPRAQGTRRRALEAVANTRRNHLSISRAAREARTSVASVRRYAGRTVAWEPRRQRYRIKTRDTLLRRVRFLTLEGVAEIEVADSRFASSIARHMNAVRLFLETGETGTLRQFRGRSVRTADGRRLVYLTDPQLLQDLAEAELLEFNTLYAKVG